MFIDLLWYIKKENEKITMIVHIYHWKQIIRREFLTFKFNSVFFWLFSSALVPPSINDSGNEFTANEGDSVRLSCEASGSPKPQIKWSKNGVRIDVFNSDYLIDETGSLTILSADAKDSAIYTCTAANIIGLTEKRTNVFVQSALSPCS